MMKFMRRNFQAGRRRRRRRETSSVTAKKKNELRFVIKNVFA